MPSISTTETAIAFRELCEKFPVYSDVKLQWFYSLTNPMWEKEIERHDDEGKQLLRNLKNKIEQSKKNRRKWNSFNPF